MISLAQLKIDQNVLSGAPIPTTWVSSMRQLQLFSANANRLNGTLPEIGSGGGEGSGLLALQQLSFFSNSITGTLPSSWGSRLTNLQILTLSDNKLYGTMPPEWSLLTNLTILQLHINSLSGSLPANWGPSLGGLTTFYAHQLSLSGTLPSSWCFMGALSELHFWQNRLSGSLPESWSLLQNLKHFAAYGNSLAGSLPASWGNWTNIIDIRLSNNALTGPPLPVSWYSMSSLQQLYLDGNQLDGTLPEMPRNSNSWQGVWWISFLSNHITGTLPSSWGQLSRLRTLGMAENFIGGTLPTEWSQMSSLTSLDVSNNNISGSLPESWAASLPYLSSVTLANNRLSSTLPDSWGNFPQLSSLTLSKNYFSGTLPVSWSSATLMSTLWLDSNVLTGTLPSNWSGMARLVDIRLGGNLLSGTVPSDWSTMQVLGMLRLNNNLLDGTLPSSWGRGSGLQRYLSEFTIFSNRISGSLPDSWSALGALQFFDAHDNRLTGSIPISWSALTMLYGLTLNDNRLSGTLSPLLSLPRMLLLNLRRNEFSGTFPASWVAVNNNSGGGAAGIMTSLALLDVSGNRLRGSLPTLSMTTSSSPSLVWKTSLFTVNVSGNCLEGFVPASWGVPTAGSFGVKTTLDVCNTRIHPSVVQTYPPVAGVRNLDFSSCSDEGQLSIVMRWPAYCQAMSGSASQSSQSSITASHDILSHTPTQIMVAAPTIISSTATSVLVQGSSVSAAVSSLLAMPASALSSRRLSVLASLGNCADDSRPSVNDAMNGDTDVAFLDSPLQLQLNTAEGNRGSVQRGTIVGDIAVAAMCVAVGGVLTVAVHFWTMSDSERRNASWRKRKREQRLRRMSRRSDHNQHNDEFDEETTCAEQTVAASARLRLPGLFFVLIALFLQPIVTSSMQLLAYGDASVDDVIGVCGVVVTVTLVATIARVVDPRRDKFRGVARDVDEEKLHHRRGRLRSKNRFTRCRATVEARWVALHEESNEWRARDEVHDHLFVERYGFLFESCREARHWWVLVEMSATIVLAVVGGVVPPTSVSCVGMAWFALCLCVVLLAACVVARPMSSVLESGVVVLLWGSQVAMAACAVSGNADEAAAVIGIVSSTLSGVLAVLMMMTAVRNAQWDKELMMSRVAPTLSSIGKAMISTANSAAAISTLLSERNKRKKDAALEMIVKLICDQMIAVRDRRSKENL
ncbi:GP46-like surface antigen, putative [Bodo saltans]|uniref:GP46-like surface antigen, putative n=1 Tax=Bodo saltans TaxID=75058 RepID=A0A0S4IU40_BODSA|nr:GP46-like surface antigen, putative [Bodo saltans]|eukprot:CUF31274.1 GP46-like surface antigen, putative [Bodo saltans]